MYDIYKNLLFNNPGKKCYECGGACHADTQKQPWHFFAEVMEPGERHEWINWNYQARLSLDSSDYGGRSVNKRALALSWLCPRCFVSLKDVKTTLDDIESKIEMLKNKRLLIVRRMPGLLCVRH